MSREPRAESREPRAESRKPPEPPASRPQLIRPNLVSLPRESTAGSPGLSSRVNNTSRDAPSAREGLGATVRPDADARLAPSSKDNLTEPRLKIAVFIDFDNIEIGVKTTLGQQFDIAAILEGIKERGEVVTKVAYGDWKRAGDHSRLLSQHAIRMVQRNLTPGGDKNGADINLALDALEMAFTHDHINAFVIVGGDSDFITLVEKLKQYDKKVFVVGGRQFTSLVMQKNCHEFIAYENLVGSSSSRRQPAAERRPGAPPQAGPTDVAKALPLVKRALKVLVDREVSPQLGLLKSTLLQLDSTFSERDYGASTFRDFIEKVAQTGLVTLRHAGRSLLVDLADTPSPDTAAPANGGGPAAQAATERAPETQPEAPAEAAEAAPAEPRDTPLVEAVDPVQGQQGIARAQEIFQRAAQAPRWPMYVRQVKQYLRAADEGFDERKYGYSTIVEFLRAAQREGLFRLERDRQGVLRVFAGAALQRPPTPSMGTPPDGDLVESSPPPAGEGYSPMADAMAEAAEPALGLETEPLLDDAQEPRFPRVEAIDAAPEPVPDEDASDAQPFAAHTPEASEGTPPAAARRTRRSPAGTRRTTRKTAGTKTATPRAPRARKPKA